MQSRIEERLQNCCVQFLVYHKPPDTVGEITTRRQKPLVLRIMVEQGRTRILFLCGPKWANSRGGSAISRARSHPASKRTHGAFWLLHYAQVAHQRLLSKTTLDPADPALSLLLGGTALLRKVGETFHCRPSSVTTVTVFLL